MRPDDLRHLLQIKPFRPFRLWILEVTALEIRHPKQIMVGKSTATIALPAGALAIPFDDDQVTVSLLHISRLEALPPPVPSNGG